MISETMLLQRVKPVLMLSPASVDGTSTNSAVIDRQGYDTAYVVVQYAAPTGTPTAAVAAVTLKTNTASSTSSPTPTTHATLASALDISAAGLAYYAVDLSGANRYVFLNWDATYTDGTTPANIISAQIVLGDKKVNPPVADTIYGRS